jgi:hypothetical protein
MQRLSLPAAELADRLHFVLQVVQAMVCPLIQIGAVLLAITVRVYESHTRSDSGTEYGAHYGQSVAIRFRLAFTDLYFVFRVI